MKILVTGSSGLIGSEAVEYFVRKPRVGSVTAASNEQTQGIDQVNTAIEQMNQTTQSNAANAEESAAASEELSAQARELNDMVDRLRAVVGGRGAPGSGTSAFRGQNLANATPWHESHADACGLRRRGTRSRRWRRKKNPP